MMWGYPHLWKQPISSMYINYGTNGDTNNIQNFMENYDILFLETPKSSILDASKLLPEAAGLFDAMRARAAQSATVFCGGWVLGVENGDEPKMRGR